MLDWPQVYAAWQAPFERRKLEPVFERNDLGSVRRVLDVGCGPGTSTRYFAAAEYLGVDLSSRYIRYARRKYGRHFLVADVRHLRPREEGAGRFDFILVNSLLHHLDDVAVRDLLVVLRSLLCAGGHVHCLELVMPRRQSIARMLARADRGRFARSLQSWAALWTDLFEPVTTFEYPVRAAGVTLWNMVYFKGRRPS